MIIMFASRQLDFFLRIVNYDFSLSTFFFFFPRSFYVAIVIEHILDLSIYVCAK